MKKVKISLKNQARSRLLRNQMSSLILFGEITTTLPKAKFLKSGVESFISSLDKQNDLGRVKLSAKNLYGPAVKKAIDVKFGKVRIFKLGNRFGDSAPIAKVSMEIIEGSKKVKESAKKDKSEKTTKTKVVK